MMATATTHKSTTHKMLDRISASIRQTILSQAKREEQKLERMHDKKESISDTKSRAEFVYATAATFSRINF